MPNPVLAETHHSRIAHFTSRHYRAVLLAAVVTTLFSLHWARQLRLESDVVALLPDDSESVVALRQITEKLGGTGDLQVMIRSPNAEQSIEYGKTLLSKIRLLPWVEHASMGNPTDFFESRKLLYIDLEDLRVVEERIQERIKYETLAAHPFFIELEATEPPSLDVSDIEQKYRRGEARSPYFRNPSGSILLILVQPKGLASDFSYAQLVQREMQELVASTDPAVFHPSMRVEVGGAYRNRINEYEAITSDVKSGSVVVALAIMLLIVFYFRSGFAVLVIMVPLAMSLSWAFAVAFALIGSLNLVTVFLVVVLMGLGLDFGIHLLARYQDERAPDVALEVALGRTLRTAGRASLTAAFTTAACFLSLLATEFRGFVEFGIIASTGLLMAAIAYFTVLPALLTMLAKRNWMPPRSKPIPRRPRNIKRWHARVVLALSVCLVATAVFVGRYAEFEYDLRNLRAKMPETREFNQRVLEVFPKARDPAAVLVVDSSQVPHVVNMLKGRMQATSPNSPIDSVLSALDLMPQDQDQKLAVLARLGAKVDELLEILDEEEQTTFASVRDDLNAKRVDSVYDLPGEIRRKFSGLPGTPGQVVYVYQSGSLLDLRMAQKFSRTLDDLHVEGARYQAISEPLIYVAMLRALNRETPRALLFAGASLLILLLLDFRSIGAVCIVLVPLLSGLALMAGCMALIPIRLNFLNVIVLPSLLGLGVDGGVHMYHGIQERGTAAIGETLRKTGSAVGACTLSSLLGFSGMLIADHPGLRSIGLLALVGLLGCLFGALVILPAMAMSFASGERGV